MAGGNGGKADITDEVLGQRLEAPVLLGEETRTCPVCGRRTLKTATYVYKVPYFGMLLITTGQCSSCGYKFRDVKIAEAGPPKKIVVRVEGERELRYLLVKSAFAIVYIPERGYEIVPGPASTGFITTVEGILHRIKEALSVACRDKPGDPKCREHEEWLDRAIEGREKFTLVICDFEGASKVAGKENVEEKHLDEECLRYRDRVPPWLLEGQGVTRP